MNALGAADPSSPPASRVAPAAVAPQPAALIATSSASVRPRIGPATATPRRVSQRARRSPSSAGRSAIAAAASAAGEHAARAAAARPPAATKAATRDERAGGDRGELLVSARRQDLRRRRAEPLALAHAVDEADGAAGLVAQHERARPDAQHRDRAERRRPAGATRSAASAPGRAARPPAARSRRPASSGSIDQSTAASASRLAASVSVRPTTSAMPASRRKCFQATRPAVRAAACERIHAGPPMLVDHWSTRHRSGRAVTRRSGGGRRGVGAARARCRTRSASPRPGCRSGTPGRRAPRRRPAGRA